jgi:hypothetical protein
MPVATFVEISIVIEARHAAEGLRDLDFFTSRARSSSYLWMPNTAKCHATRSAVSARDGIARD